MSTEKFRWALYQVDTSRRMFEIDVEPPMTREALITRLIFRGSVVPKVGSLSSTLYVDFERWRVEWAKGTGKTMLASLNGPFQYFLLMSHFYGRGWRERARRERIEMQMREIERNIWWAIPQERFGWRSPNDLANLKPGPYEIIGQGFVWVGHDGRSGGRVFQFHPLFQYESINKDLRWYLERGTSLAEALALHVRQSTRINLQMIAGFAVALAERPNLGSGTFWEDVADIMDLATDRSESTPSHKEGLAAAMEHFANHPDERRIQELAKKRTVPIVKLSSKK